MKKTKNRIPSINELLINNSARTIQMRHADMLRMINHATITLFWEIGLVIKNHLRQDEVNVVPKNLIKHVSDIFMPHFGSYFSPENILLMKQFADSCSPEAVNHISGALRWEYIPPLLNLKTDDAWIFYARHIYQVSPTTKQLKKEISQKLFEENGLQLKYPQYPFFGLVESDLFKNESVKAYFEGAKGQAFRLLFEPPSADKIKFPESYLMSGVAEEVILNIYHKVLDFQTKYNHWLNVYFNMFFWHLGHEILRILDSLELAKSDVEIDNLIKQLEQQFGGFFSQDQIYDSIKFAKQFKDPGQNIKLAQIVRWEHIKILLRIDDQDAQLFYAYQVLEKGLSTEELEKLIQSNSYIPKREKKEETLKDNLQESKSKHGKKSLNVVSIAVEEIVSLQHDLNRNIFKNPDLMKYLKSQVYLADGHLTLSK